MAWISTSRASGISKLIHIHDCQSFDCNLVSRVNLIPTGQYVTSQLVHFEKGPIVEASTSEWAIKKQLYRTTDTSAYTNLAKVFAQRCLEAGFIEMRCDFKFTRGEKLRKFVKTLKSSGLLLHEWEHVRPQLEVNHYVGRREKPYGDWEEH